MSSLRKVSGDTSLLLFFRIELLPAFLGPDSQLDVDEFSQLGVSRRFSCGTGSGAAFFCAVLVCLFLLLAYIGFLIEGLVQQINRH